MKIRRSKRGHAVIEAGALSDILFFLMLFFLIISTLASPSAIKLLLPKASTGQTVPKQVITLSIKSDKSCFIGGRTVSFDALQAELEQEGKKFDNPTIVLRIDKELNVETLIQVVDAVNKTHIPLVVATEKSKS
jgi:biopolymer transport protein ExbD